MKNIEQIASHSFPIFCNFLIIKAALQREQKLIPILFDDETNKLLYRANKILYQR